MNKTDSLSEGLLEQATARVHPPAYTMILVRAAAWGGKNRGTPTGSWNAAVRPKDGLSSATSEEQYTASTPVDTREFMSGDSRLSDASPDCIRLAPSTTN